MATYNVTVQVASVTDEGWESSIGLPTFQVEATHARHAVRKALEIVCFAADFQITTILFGPVTTLGTASGTGKHRGTQYHVCVVEN